MTAMRPFLAGLCAVSLLGACALQTGERSATLPAPGPDWPVYSAESVPAGMDGEAVSALEARMAQFVTDGDTPGIATLLVRNGQVVSHVQAGIADLERGTPIETDTIYRIYSMTKPITGVALMMLYEDGEFSLDDPVARYVPEFADLRVLTGETRNGSPVTEALVRQPTMRELMSHTAGFAYGLSGDDPANTAFRERQILYAPDLDTFIDQVGEVPLLFQPGEAWYYSAAVDIQGAIVERLSGQRFGAFLDERIFAPLGMDDTGFHVPDADLARFSDLFAVDPETGDIVPYQTPRTAFTSDSVAMESGGGGLVSTLDDYARFALMLANGGALGDTRLLQPETVKLMRTNMLPEGMNIDIGGTLSEEQASSAKFGLDFGIYTDTHASDMPFGEGTFYWGGAAGTWFWIDPENDLFFIAMIQLFDQRDPDPTNFWEISAQHVYDALDAGALSGNPDGP